MNSKVIFVLGTSRPRGNTRMLVDYLNAGQNAPIVDLSQHNITPYDYEYRNKNDDFLGLATHLLAFDSIVFATPVYWYSMSAQMKIFFDRLSDLVRIEKKIGRALANHKTYLVATGTDKELPVEFEEPFRLSSKYFNMTYSGSFYSCVKEDLVVNSNVVELSKGFTATLFR
jgi:multimeric flavodoxin WrbA